jgi:hypothetical protein
MIIDSPIISGSLILTGSAAFTGSLTLSGSMNTIGTITATTIVVQTITSSIDYITGSSINGSLLSNTHLFTGSLYMTGGLYITDSNIGVNTTSATSPLSLYYPSTGSDINYIKMEMPSWGGSTNFKKNIIWHDSSNVVGAIGMSFASPYTYMDFHSFYNSAHTTGSLMRIQGNGLIGIGTTAPSFRLSFGGDTATTIGMNQSILGTAPALTLKGADSTTGTNNEGGAINISAGLGTGNGATSNIIFSTGAPGGSSATRQTLTERMRITAAGNVGIGTSSPTEILHLSSSNTAAFIRFQNTGGSGTYLGSRNTDMELYTGGTEKMRITSGGDVGIGVTSPLFKFDCAGIIYSSGAGAGLAFKRRDATVYWYLYATGGAMYVENTNSGVVGNFNQASGIYTATSDINKKKDFEQSVIGLDAILGLKPTLYRMKSEDETSDKHLGFIAQEVKEFIPQAYSESVNGDDTFIGLTEMPIIAALVKAIKELNTKLDAATAEIEALKAK